MMDFIKRILNPVDTTAIAEQFVAGPTPDSRASARILRRDAQREAHKSSKAKAAEKAAKQAYAQSLYEKSPAGLVASNSQKKKDAAVYDALGQYVVTDERAQKANAGLRAIGAPIRISSDVGSSPRKSLPVRRSGSAAEFSDMMNNVDYGRTQDFQDGIKNYNEHPDFFLHPLATAKEARKYTTVIDGKAYRGDESRAAQAKALGHFVSESPSSYQKPLIDDPEYPAIPGYRAVYNPFHPVSASPRGAFAEASWAVSNPDEAKRRYDNALTGGITRLFPQPVELPDPPRRPRKR